jgi:hypothetical protein
MEPITAILSGFVVWLGGITMLMLRMWLSERRRSNGNPSSPYPLCDEHNSQLKSLLERVNEIGEKVAVLWADRNKNR